MIVLFQLYELHISKHYYVNFLSCYSKLLMEQLKARWRPEDAKTVVLEDAPVFFPAEQVFLVYCYKWHFLCFIGYASVFFMQSISYFKMCVLACNNANSWRSLNFFFRIVRHLSILQAYIPDQRNMELVVLLLLFLGSHHA